MLHPAEQYAKDITENKIVACEWTRLACERYFNDLDHGYERGLYFDREAAQHRLDFYGYCRHFEGEFAGKVIEPSPWQQFAQWNIFGWKNNEGFRRFKTAYNSVARKNGKSTDTATTGLFLGFFDNYEGAQVYTAATKLEQARIIHHASTAMVRKSEKLLSKITIYKNILSRPDKNQIYIPLGRDSKTQDGFNPHGAMIDEFHAHPDDGIYNVLKSGMATQTQPLTYIITTAGFDKTYPCFEFEERVKRVLDGSEEDDALFGIVYTLDDGDSWEDESNWIKANPNIGVNVRLEALRDDFREAKSMPSKINNFLTKHLNIWTEAQTRWITADRWNANKEPVNLESLVGKRCYGALDVSTTTDLSAWVLCFPPENTGGKYRFLYRFFLPDENMRERELREKVNYSSWIRDGFIDATPGNVIDYNFIKAQVEKDAARYSIEEVIYDPWNTSQLVNDLMSEGMNCVEFRQGFASMSPACKEFERKVLGSELATGGNPVMNWMIACTETIQDPAGNIKLVKPDRGKTGKHIDGVVASVMALYRAVMATEQGASIYETEELLIL